MSEMTSRETASASRPIAPGLALWLAGVAVVATLTLATSDRASAHDAHVDSDPPSGSQIDDPITEVRIEFGETIGDDTEIAVFDPNDDVLDSETTLVSDTAAVVTFDPIEVEGTYTARYLTSSIQDGHLLAGAISFTYGSATSGPSTLAVLVMAGGAIVILSIGAFFSYRRYRALSADGSDVDDDLSDVGV
jgi:methionine-rich copper-binding protein CopC